MEGRLDLCSGGNYNSTQEIFVQTRSWWRDPGKYGTFVGPNRISRPGHKSTEGHHSLDVFFLLYSCEFIAASTNRHITPNQRYGNRVENQHRKHLDGYSFFLFENRLPQDVYSFVRGRDRQKFVFRSDFETRRDIIFIDSAKDDFLGCTSSGCCCSTSNFVVDDNKWTLRRAFSRVVGGSA